MLDAREKLERAQKSARLEISPCAPLLEALSITSRTQQRQPEPKAIATMNTAPAMPASRVSLRSMSFACVSNDNGGHLRTVEEALERFVVEAQLVVNVAYASTRPEWVPVLVAERGPRYVRISRWERGVRSSVYCFVDHASGDILKAASFKTPAKGARGNVLSYRTVTECVSGYGAHYAR